jgi:hypothetical protein
MLQLLACLRVRLSVEGSHPSPYTRQVRKRRKFLIVLACLAPLLAAILLQNRNNKPCYDGRPLSYWVKVLGTYSPQTPHRVDAQKAIRHLGSNAVPYLLKWYAHRTPTTPNRLLSRTLGSLNSSWDFAARHRVLSAGSLEAFEILGPQAKAAIPELAAAANDPAHPDTAELAALTLPCLGPEAAPAVAATLTNGLTSAGCLLLTIPQMGSNAAPLIPQLLHFLKSTNEFFSCHSAEVLGELQLAPSLVVPALQASVQDGTPDLRTSAASALTKYHSRYRSDQTHAAVLAMLSSTDAAVRLQATNALRTIQPLTNTPAH